MRLIEKKCPNCGANLEFKDNDKSCKCSHCGCSYEIERDTNQAELSDQFDLKPLKALTVFSAFTFIEIFVVFLIIFSIIAMISFQIFNSKNKTNEKENTIQNFFSDYNKEEKLVENIKQLSNSYIQKINRSSIMKISYRAEGASDQQHSYQRNGEPKREKIYVAYKKDGNFIITIYKVNYHDFFHQENNYTLYVPVVFENVTSDVVFSLGDGEVKAPEYYFNSEKTTYTYGYNSFEQAYNEVVKPLENDYKITEK